MRRAALFAIALLLSGCVTETVKQPSSFTHGEVKTTTHNAQVVQEAQQQQTSGTESPKAVQLPAPPVKSVDPNTITNADPCAANMQNIAGALLTYYAANQKLPDNLSELSKYTDPDAPFVLRCPLSHLPYIYEHDGLHAEGKTKVIILHDAAASHDGCRWCILMSAPKSIANRSLEVVAIPESTFRLYH